MNIVEGSENQQSLHGRYILNGVDGSECACGCFCMYFCRVFSVGYIIITRVYWMDMMPTVERSWIVSLNFNIVQDFLGL